MLFADDDDVPEQRQALAQPEERFRRRVGIGTRAADDHTRAGMAQYRLRLVAAVRHVQRRQNATHHRDAEIRDGELNHVRQLNGDNVALAQPKPEQGAGESLGLPERFGIGGRAPFVHERRL